MNLIIDSMPKCKYTDERRECLRQLALEQPQGEAIADEVVAEWEEIARLQDEGGEYRYQWFGR